MRVVSQQRMGRVICMGGLLTAAVVGLLGGLLGVPALATTGDNAGLPDPHAKVAAEIGDAYVGRFYLARVPRAAHVIAGRMDFAAVTEEFPNFFFGELDLRVYEKNGRPATVVVNLYPWEYVRSRRIGKNSGTLHAGLVPSTSVTREHPYGVSVGRLSLVVPAEVHEGTGTGQKVIEQSTVTARLTFDGHTSSILLRRESDQEAPTNMRKAKIVSK